MNLSVTKRLYIGFFASFLLTAIIGIITFFTFNRQVDEAGFVTHTYRIINQTEYLQKLLVDLETGRRGFMATNDRRFLEPYSRSVVNVAPAITGLKKLLSNNSLQTERIRKLEKHVNELLGYWQRLNDADVFTREDILRITDQEKDQMDRIRREINLITSHEQHELLIRQAKTNRSVHVVSFEVVVGTLIIQIIIILLIRVILREFRIRRKAEATLLKQNEELEYQQEELHQTNEELTQQAESLRASEEELRVQEEELRQINAELEEKNEAVEMAHQALALKAQELEISGKYKSEFLANMSHELRTPLNSLLILAKLLKDNKQGNLSTKQIEYAGIIHKSGSDLLQLINDILDLSKIEAGKMELNIEAVATGDIVRDLAEAFYVQVEEKGLQFVVDKDKKLPKNIQTDKLRLEQVVKNLLSNAVKFTPKGGIITLAMYADISRKYIDGDAVAIEVKDTGIGIAKDKQKVIFEAFKQADGATNRKYGGTGLGLSISKELVAKLGGKIVLQSDEGAGSTFAVYIPVSQAAKEKMRRAEDTDIIEMSEIVAGKIKEQEKVKDDRNDIEAKDKVMLIIEDDVIFATVMRDFARTKGYKTIVALQGDEGLYYASKYKPMAITLDMQLPVIDGSGVLNVLKSNAKLKDIPVHVISGSEVKADINDAIAFLKKPVSANDMENAFSLIEKHIHQKVKRILVFTGDYLKNNALKNIIGERSFDFECDYVTESAQAEHRLRIHKYECIIADIGKNIKQGIALLKQLKEWSRDEIPVIIYLDKDLSAKDELQLKKLSDAIIRESSSSKDRLMDELELFLYKLQETEKKNVPRSKADIVAASALQGKKVLLVDDDMRNIYALSTLLEQQQMEVITAGDGKEALEQLSAHEDIDIVLMDIMMPEMDGYEAMDRIRKEPKYSKLPVIALTAKAMPGDEQKCIEAGASDYITKPVDGNRLFSLMRVWLSQ